MNRAAALALLALLAAGCVPLAATPVPPRAAAVPRDTARVATPPARAARAAVDSLPGADARAVLATIPEPIPASERVPPPEMPAAPVEGGADVPVPAATTPLGERRPPDSLFAAPGAARDSAAAAPADRAPELPERAAPPATPPGATGEPCWRVQVAAPPEADEAERRRSAAESLLLVPFVVERESGRYKVRSRGCLDADGAQRLRQRAADSGFEGAFRYRSPKPS